jgi:hypothetical protein
VRAESPQPESVDERRFGLQLGESSIGAAAGRALAHRQRLAELAVDAGCVCRERAVRIVRLERRAPDDEVELDLRIRQQLLRVGPWSLKRAVL